MLATKFQRVRTAAIIFSVCTTLLIPSQAAASNRAYIEDITWLPEAGDYGAQLLTIPYENIVDTVTVTLRVLRQFGRRSADLWITGSEEDRYAMGDTWRMIDFYTIFPEYEVITSTIPGVPDEFGDIIPQSGIWEVGDIGGSYAYDPGSEEIDYVPPSLETPPWGTFTYALLIQVGSDAPRWVSGEPMSALFMTTQSAVDDEGLNWGFGQKWHIPYQVQSHGSLRVRVYEGVIFDPDDHKETYMSPTPFNVHYDGMFFQPPGESAIRTIQSDPLAPGPHMQTWDWRNDSGEVVEPGQYTVFLEAFDSNGNRRDAHIQVVTVTPPEIRSLNASAISNIDSSANIDFDTNFSGSHTILIGAPGTVFKPASSTGTLTIPGYGDLDYELGDPIPDGPDPGENIVKVYKSFLGAGRNRIRWSGDDHNKDVLPNGLYKLAITAFNERGERIVRGIEQTTIAIDRSVEMPPDTEAPQLTNIVPGSGQHVFGTLESIEFILTDETAINNDKTHIEIITPDFTVITDGDGGDLTYAGSAKTVKYTFTFDDPLEVNGMYYVYITAEDAWLNRATIQSFFNIFVSDSDHYDPLELTAFWLLEEEAGEETHGNQLEWSRPGEFQGDITYTIHRLFGYGDAKEDGDEVAYLLNKTEHFDIPDIRGTYTYWIRAEDSYGRVTEGVTLSRFFEMPIEYNDADGQKAGYGQRWEVSYSMLYDSNISVTVFSSTTLMGDFTRDTSGFFRPNPGVYGINTIMDNKLTTAILDGSQQLGNLVLNEFIWRWDDSFGRLVPPGEEYYILLEAVYEGNLVDTVLLKLPVFDLSISRLTTANIDFLNEQATADFFLSGDAEIMMLIAEPDTRFAAASSTDSLNYLTNYYYEPQEGHPIPVQEDGVTPDPDSIVRVIRYSRPFGMNTIEWTGLNQAANPVPNGNYRVALIAYNSSGYLSPRKTFSLNVDRGEITPPEDTGPLLYEVNPSSGSKLGNGLHQVRFILKDESGIDHSATSITVTGPRDAPVTFSHGSAATLFHHKMTSTSTHFALVLDTPTYVEGYYDALIETADVWGNTSSFTTSFIVSTTTPRLVSINPDIGAELVQPLSTIRFTLSDYEGGWIRVEDTILNIRRGSTVSQYTPGDGNLYYSVEGAEAEFILSLEDPIGAGEYTLEIIAYDKWGFENTLQSSFSISAVQDFTIPNLTRILPEDQSIRTSPVSRIRFTLRHSDGIDPIATTVSIIGPEGEIYGPGMGGNLSSVRRTFAEREFTFSFSDPLIVNGRYTVIMYAVSGTIEEEEEEEEGGGGGGAVNEITTTFTLDLPQSSAEFARTVKAFPQPIRSGAATITYDIDEASELNLTIYNLMQEKIYSENFGVLVGGGTIQWNMTDDSGRRVAPGIYFYHMVAESDTNKIESMKRIVVVR